MKTSIMFCSAGALCLSLGLLFGPVRADSIDLSLTGFNLNYAGNRIYDAGGTASALATGQISNAAGLTSIQLFDNGNLLPGGSLTGNLYADLLINNVTIPKAGGLASGSNGNSFGLDLLQYNAATSSMTRLLGLTLDSTDVYYSKLGNFVTFGGTVSSIAAQNLGSYGLQLGTGDPVTLSLTGAGMTNIQSSGANLTSFSAFASGDVNGGGSYQPSPIAPEPSSLIGVLILSAAALAGYVWRRRIPGASRA
jgi:hypothetical protein